MALKQTAFRLDNTDLKVLDRLKKELGVETRSAVVRYLIRQAQKRVSRPR